jgi:hypothetical protein
MAAILYFFTCDVQKAGIKRQFSLTFVLQVGKTLSLRYLGGGDSRGGGGGRGKEGGKTGSALMDYIEILRLPCTVTCVNRKVIKGLSFVCCTTLLHVFPSTDKKYFSFFKLIQCFESEGKIFFVKWV